MKNLECFEGFKKEIEYEVSEQIYNKFQECSGDYNLLHLDDEYAKKRGFSERIMYGNILNVFISHAVGMMLPIGNVILQTQEIQYKQPVYMMDKLLFIVYTKDIYEEVNSVLLAFKFIKQNGSIVAKGKILIGVFE